MSATAMQRIPILATDDDQHLFVCHECIGDIFLKRSIKKSGTVRLCVNCGKSAESIGFDDLCERVHEVVEAEYQRTPSESEHSFFEWEPKGDEVDDVLYEILECDDGLIAPIKARLSSVYYSFEDAKIGQENPYGDEVRYTYRKPDDHEFASTWRNFEEEIRTKARFFSRRAEKTLDDIFGELSRYQTNNKSGLIRAIGPDTDYKFIYRARRALSQDELRTIVERPASELAPPPSKLVVAGRMNPYWVPMFYGAFDPETCVAEVRAPVGSHVVIGKFEVIRSLRLLNLAALENLYVKEGSYFDPAFRRLRERARFLKRLVRIMSRPVMPNEEEYHYLPTQVVAEYLSEKIEPKLDGIIFPSSQRGGDGENLVLFNRSSTVEPDDTPLTVQMHTDFGWKTEDDEDLDITVWTKKRILADPETDSDEITKDWDDLGPMSKQQAALRVLPNELEVRDINAIEYKFARRHVRRYSEDSLADDEIPI
jgi:hypothetical protein